MANNLKSPPIVEAPLNILGGLYTEADPNDLPPGASPRTTNCDYRIGSVLKRPGLKSSFYFLDFFIEKITGFAQSVADGPNELAWSNPINATKGIPGTYASVALNTSLSPVSGVTGFDKNDGGAFGNNVTPVVGPTISPAEANEWAISVINGLISGSTETFTPSGSGTWTGFGAVALQQITSGPINLAGSFALACFWAECLALLKVIGGLPATVQAALTGTAGVPISAGPFASPITAGNMLLCVLQGTTHDNLPGNFTVSDGVNNWVRLASSSNFNEGGTTVGPLVEIWAAFNAAAGSPTFTITGPIASGAGYSIAEYPAGDPGHGGFSLSEQLQALNFPLAIPAGVGVIGFQVEVTGKQTSADADAFLTLSLIDPSPDSPEMTFQLPSVEGTVVLGDPTENWGLALTPALLNNPNFGVQLQAQVAEAVCTFDISAIKLKVFITPNPPPNINYLKTFEQQAGEIRNLLLDSNGIMWEEDPLITPGGLNEVVANILPDTFAQSTTEDNREFIALSNLLNGTDLPYTYNGVNFDRCSQIGPGAAPTVKTTSAQSAIQTITQQAAFPLHIGNHDWILVSDSPSDIGDFGAPATPGNVLTLIFDQSITVPAYITAGSNLFLSGFPTLNGNVVNNDPTGAAAPPFYTVTSVGQKIIGQQSYDAITMTVNFTTFYNQKTTVGSTIRSTTATMTTAQQVPNLEVGNTFQATGTGGAPPGGYDSTWTVLTTPNAAQMAITSTALVGNVATYGFVLQTGVNPVVGQAVTVTLTLNGNGIFNVTNAIIRSVSAGTFSVNLVGANISSAPESGAAIIFGTIFTFDAFAIIGNKSGGNVLTTGIIGEGQRQCCYSFQTRNGYISQPSPICKFNVTSGASKIAVANLQPGPSDVIARIVFFTAGNGGNFYWIAQPVPVIDNGVTRIDSSTVVRDNVTTNATFSFSDETLLGTAGAGGSADVQGSNYFETKELGACRGFVQYNGRMFAIGEQNKVSNFRGLSFDGGIGVVQSTAGAGGGTGGNNTYPLGWTVDPTNGAGGSVVPSSIFGNSYQITGTGVPIRGMIFQNAYQDEFMVPIINASTTYSVRVTCAVSAGTTGNLIVALFSPALNRNLGFFSLDLATVTANFGIFTGVLLTAPLAPVPNDLILRVYAINLSNGGVLSIDRVEPFPTEKPNLNGQIIGSYQQNFEAFDRVTGIIDGNTTNQQPINAAFVLFDTLYMVKTKTILAINSVAGAEPVQWGTPRTVSQAAGTDSVYGVTTDDQGQEWALIAGRNGLYLFTGGEPIRISEEISSLWGTINWAYGYTVVVKNDVINRRILIFAPLKMPEKDRNGNFPGWYHPSLNLTANPTTPNVCLAMSYKQLFTAGELGDRIEVHASSYTGKLLTIDISRKWSIWTVKAPAAAFLEQANGNSPLFMGNSDHTGKAYRFDESLLDDDGGAVEQRYCTYGFVSTDQEQQLQLGSVRKQFSFKRMLMTGLGRLRMNMYIDSLFSDYSTTLEPDIVLPQPISGDIEIPLNETGERAFFEYVVKDVGAAFNISKINVGLRQDPWSPTRGRND